MSIRTAYTQKLSEQKTLLESVVREKVYTANDVHNVERIKNLAEQLETIEEMATVAEKLCPKLKEFVDTTTNALVSSTTKQPDSNLFETSLNKLAVLSEMIQGDLTPNTKSSYLLENVVELQTVAEELGKLNERQIGGFRACFPVVRPFLNEEVVQQAVVIGLNQSFFLNEALNIYQAVANIMKKIQETLNKIPDPHFKATKEQFKVFQGFLKKSVQTKNEAFYIAQAELVISQFNNLADEWENFKSVHEDDLNNVAGGKDASNSIAKELVGALKKILTQTPNSVLKKFKDINKKPVYPKGLEPTNIATDVINSLKLGAEQTEQQTPEGNKPETLSESLKDLDRIVANFKAVPDPPKTTTPPSGASAATSPQPGRTNNGASTGQLFSASPGTFNPNLLTTIDKIAKTVTPEELAKLEKIVNDAKAEKKTGAAQTAQQTQQSNFHVRASDYKEE